MQHSQSISAVLCNGELRVSRHSAAVLPGVLHVSPPKSSVSSQTVFPRVKSEQILGGCRYRVCAQQISRARGLLPCRRLAKDGAVHCPSGPLLLRPRTGDSRLWASLASLSCNAGGVACREFWYSLLFFSQEFVAIHTQITCRTGNLSAPKPF